MSATIIAMLIWVGTARCQHPLEHTVPGVPDASQPAPCAYPTTLPNFATLADCTNAIPVVLASYERVKRQTGLVALGAECVTLRTRGE